MRKIALALLAMLVSASFSLNASASIRGDNILFIIDGDHYAQTNLTIFVQKDGVQLRGAQKNSMGLPYYYPVPYNESGNYSMSVSDEKGAFAQASISVVVPNEGAAAQQQAQDQSGTEIAIIAAIIGFAALAYLSLRFIKFRSDNK
ncbi:Uncharacterised protein [uncultured archaeon]|nr:Uncharacterised protein [uncultured archaeon]